MEARAGSVSDDVCIASPHGGREGSAHLSTAAAVVLVLLFVGTTVLRVRGSLTHYDLRLVAHLVPLREHPRALALAHPLVHLGDLAFVLAFTLVACGLLWLAGYRRTWALLTVGLSWPLELVCKSNLPQPDGLGTSQASVTLSSLVHGAATRSVSGWLQHATPEGVRALAGQAGGWTLNLTSSYPSGTTARATFVLGLLVWAAFRLGVPALSELLALALLAPLSVLGVAMVLYAWHWPSDVAGGYLLGFALLALALALLRRPTASSDAYGPPVTLKTAALRPVPGGSSSSPTPTEPTPPVGGGEARVPLPWVRHH
jgi:membrane-associated phospholipid phosphatase